MVKAKTVCGEISGVGWLPHQGELAVPKRKSAHNDTETFGQRLAHLRKTAGLTQRELAAELNTSQRMIAYYESQTEHPPTHLLPMLAEVLGVSADVLLGLKPGKQIHRLASERLHRRLKQIEQLPPKERKQLLTLIDAFLDRDRLARAQRS